MKKITGYVKLQLPRGQGEPLAARRPGARPARRQHHGVLQRVQRQDRRRRHDHPRGDHGLLGPQLHLHHQDAARVGPPQEERAGLPTAKKPGAGSKEPNKNKVGSITTAGLKKLAELKMRT